MKKRKSRRPGQPAALSESGTCESSALTRQLQRRRDAAKRSVPLDCGCRDPWICKCTRPPLTERALDGWRDAARHVLATGEIPLVPIEVRRALWRRPADRALAEHLHDACGRIAS